MRGSKKTAAGKSAAGKQGRPTIEGLQWRVRHNPKLPKRSVLTFLELLAQKDNCTPGQWLARAAEIDKRRQEKDAIEEKWDEALANTITIDGFFCMDNEPSIHVIAFKEGNLVYYNGETLKPVEMKEALRILRDINDAAQWFMVEPWNGGDCSFSGNAAWYSRLLMHLPPSP